MVTTNTWFTKGSVTPFPYAMTPLNNITGFTYRDGITYLKLLEEIVCWVENTVGVEYQAALEKAYQDFLAGIKNSEDTVIATKDDWDLLFQAFMSNFDAELQALNDQAMSSNINNPSTETAIALAAIYATKTNLEAARLALQNQVTSNANDAALERTKLSNLVTTVTDNNTELQANITAEVTRAKADVNAKTDGILIGNNGKKYRIVACALRNTGSGFELINDAAHIPIGVASVTSDDVSITVNYSFIGKAVGSLTVTPDETFAKAGVSFGASVGLNSSVIQASQAGGAHDYITWDAANSKWTSFTGFAKNITMEPSGSIVFDHDTVTPSSGGSATARTLTRRCGLGSIGAIKTEFYFLDSAGVTDKAPIAGHAAWITRSGSVRMKVADMVYPNSNIWINGVIEV